MKRVVHLDSIRNRILVLALLATLIPTLSTAWISYTQNRRSLTDKISEELQRVSAQTAREVDLWIKERLYDVRVFSSSFQVSENLERVARGRTSGPAARQALTRITDYLRSVEERFSDYDELLVVAAGRGVVATSSDEVGSISLPDDWLAQLPGNKFVHGNAYWDAELGRAAMMIAVPIIAPDQSFVGALTARLNFGAIVGMLERFAPADSGRVYLVTQDGTVIVGSDSSSQQLMQTRLPAAAQLTLTTNEGKPAEYTSYTGATTVGTRMAVPQVDWAVVAEVPQRHAYTRIVRLRNITLLVVMSLVVGVGLIAYLLGMFIVRPLDRLTEGARQVAAGDLDVDLPVRGGGEVGYLTEVFNEMVMRLRHSRQELERLSHTDALTGLHNRRHLMDILEKEVSRAKRHKHPFTVLMMDVDHFKKFNDRFGHLAGDEVLTKVAGIVTDSLRGIDHAARYGGEEFLVMLPETGLEGGGEVAERIRARVDEEIHAGVGDTASVTVSIGAAAFPDDGDTPEAVLAAADAAMYQAKRRGRNRVSRSTRKREKNAKREA